MKPKLIYHEYGHPQAEGGVVSGIAVDAYYYPAPNQDLDNVTVITVRVWGGREKEIKRWHEVAYNQKPSDTTRQAINIFDDAMRQYSREVGDE